MKRFSSLYLTKKIYLHWRIRQYMLLKAIDQRRSREESILTLPYILTGRIFNVNHVGTVVRRLTERHKPLQNVVQANLAACGSLKLNQRRLHSFEGNDDLPKRLGKHQEKVYDHCINGHLCDLHRTNLTHTSSCLQPTGINAFVDKSQF